MRDRVLTVTSLERGTPVGYVRECEDRVGFGTAAQNYFGYAVAPAPLQQILTTDDVGGLDVVIACDRWREGEAIGALRLEGESVFASQVWIMPGPLQESLDAEGRLLPAFDPTDPVEVPQESDDTAQVPSDPTD